MINTKMVRGTSRDDIGKIFVGGLSTETTKEGLQEHFSDFGEVSDCIVMVDTTTKRSRGFGFVTFKDPEAVDKVFKQFEHFLDNKKIDPKRAVPRGPGQQAMLSTQGPGAPTGRGPPSENSNENKVFVGGLSSHTTEEDLRTFFSTIGKVSHVKLMYDKESNRMRGFGFVTFESSEAYEEACRIHYHDINGKKIEAKKAEERGPRMGGGGGGGGGNMGMGGGQYGGYPAVMQGHFPPASMGRGYAGYNPMPPGYPGTAPMVGAGYGYGAGYDQSSMYAQQNAAAAPGYAAAYGAVPTSAASMVPTAGGYDYSQMTAASQAGMSAANPGAQPRMDTPAAADYSAYGLGNYQQQESSYGPARTSFTSDPSSYSAYGANAADQTGYAPAAAAAAAAAYGGGENFGRRNNVSRGFQPYGR